MNAPLSIKQCQAILNRGDRQYSPAEVQKIRELFTVLLTLQVEAFYDSQRTARLAKKAETFGDAPPL